MNGIRLRVALLLGGLAFGCSRAPQIAELPDASTPSPPIATGSSTASARAPTAEPTMPAPPAADAGPAFLTLYRNFPVHAETDGQVGKLELLQDARITKEVKDASWYRFCCELFPGGPAELPAEL